MRLRYSDLSDSPDTRQPAGRSRPGRLRLLYLFRQWLQHTIAATGRLRPTIGVGLSSLMALVPVLSAYAVARAVSAASSGSASIYYWLAGLAGLAGVIEAASRLRQYLTGWCRRRLNALGMIALIQTAEAVDWVDTLDSPQAQDEIVLAQEEGVQAASDALVSLSGVTERLLTLAIFTGSGLLLDARTGLSLTLIIAAQSWAASRISRRRNEFILNTIEAERERFSYKELLRNHATHREMVLYQRSHYFAERATVMWSRTNRTEDGYERHYLRSGLAAAGVSAAALALAGVQLANGVAAERLSVAEMVYLTGALVSIAGTTGAAISEAFDLRLALHRFSLFLDRSQRRRAMTVSTPEAHPRRPTDVTMERVSYTYPGRISPSAVAISLHLEAGEFVAVVGPNGAGKSTLAKLAAGLAKPSHGAILHNGVEVGDSQAETPNHAAVLFQDFAEFELTLGENIALGRGLSPTKVVDVAKRVGLDPVAHRLPGGFDALISRRFTDSLADSFATGAQLSGGEWQRVALARALYSDPPLLILDEPLSSVDPASEREIIDTICDLSGKATLLVVSHRFSLVRCADRIVVMDRGAIVDEGSHQELLAGSDWYRHAFIEQAELYQ